MTLVEHPYAAAAVTYLKRGVGSPIPLPYRAKKPPLDGWTGYDAPYASGADVMEWSSNGAGRGNIALRLVETVIGIDVDAYGTKVGAITLAEQEARLGPLPETFASTSKPAPSGIRLFRVPAGRAWADVVGPGVEVIHYGHRYCVVAPSIHPDTGDAYFWVMSGDWSRVAGPSLDQLPDLPPPWVKFLDRGPASERSLKASVSSSEVVAMLAGFVPGEPCPWLEKVLNDSRTELSAAASRHDVARHWCLMVVRAGEQGHVGADSALALLKAQFSDALRAGESRKLDHGEWERMVEGAVALVLESPTAPADRGCCGSPDSGVDLSFDPGESDALEHFWESREYLSHIRRYARAKWVSPWAMLGVVMARMAVRVRHEVVLPDLVGGYGSLNSFYALVGASGLGKGAAEAAAELAVTFGQEIEQATVGTGEGVGHLFRRRVKGELEWIRHSVLFSVQEVDTLAALGQRQGTTLLSELRKAWSGERLGFSNADPARTMPLPRHEYRLALIVGVQPLRAGGLLDDADGGTPQRFIWLPAGDRQASRQRPTVPEPWAWPGLDDALLWNHHGLAVMGVPAVAVDEIEETRYLSLREETDPLDGHALQARLKVAAALALLDSRYDVTEKDWELAGTVMLVSNRTRERVQATMRKAVTESDRARAIREGEREVIRIERVEGAVAGRCREKVLGMLGGQEWTAHRDLANGLSRPQREHLEPILAELLGNGKIERKEGEDREHFRLRVGT